MNKLLAGTPLPSEIPEQKKGYISVSVSCKTLLRESKPVLKQTEATAKAAPFRYFAYSPASFRICFTHSVTRDSVSSGWVSSSMASPTKRPFFSAVE
jgi:hypothetical protein